MKYMETLFKKSRERAENPPKNTFWRDFHRAAADTYAALPKWERFARSMAEAIRSQKIYIDPEDRIIGRVYYTGEIPPEVRDPDYDFNTRPRLWTEKEDPAYTELVHHQLASWGSPGHIAWNWDLLLREGTEGLRKRCFAGMEAHRGEPECEQFYRGVLILLDGMDDWNDRHVRRLEEMGKKEEARICRKVPRYPAETFREALQAWFMQHIVVMKENPYGGNSPGRLDYYLWPYLEADLAEGRCTLAEAEELIEETFLRIDERLFHMDGWVESVMVGGCHPDGTSAVNPLSSIMIRAYSKYNITHPHLYARLPDNPPEDYVRLCADYVLRGENRAQLLNDPAVMRALRKNGVAESDAAHYYCGGCMEIGVQGKTSDFLFVGFQNLPKLLELCITGGYCLTEKKPLTCFRPDGLETFCSFEEFYRSFLAQAKKIIHANLDYQDRLSAYTAENRPAYLLSSMVDDCLARGRNMHDGGAVYHDYGFSLIGIPNTADSLYAIRRAVFEDRFCTAEELIEAMKADFSGHEFLRQKLLALPKYGQEHPEADAMAARLMKDLGEICRSYRNRFGGNGKMVILSFVWAPEAGRILGATPDGRHAGVPVAQAVTPQCMAMTEGITAAINSCVTLPFEEFSGGASTMWDLDPSWASPEVVGAVVRAFFAGGGHIFQGNMTDVETLRKAQENPEEYPNLLVRVGGYSARFNRLHRELQNDIIRRMRHTH